MKLLTVFLSLFYLKNFTNFKISNNSSQPKIEVPNSTIGASVDVIMHQPSHSANANCLELWDISGTQNHKSTRHIFYNNLNGIILVHDLSNSKSLENLKCWLREVNSTSLDSVETKNDLADHFDMEADSSNSRHMPLILVGMKKLQINKHKINEIFNRSNKFSREIRSVEVNLDIEESVQKFANTPNNTSLMYNNNLNNDQVLTGFLDKCVQHAVDNSQHHGFTSAMTSGRNLDHSWRQNRPTQRVGVSIKMD